MTEEIKVIPTNGTSAEDVAYAKKVKEIYIDGVDVAGCVRLQDDKISCDLGGECKGWENCYYKQLKRLEQENKELKRQKRELGNVAQGFIKDIDKEKLIAKKYRSVLEEIREIADKCKECLNEDDDCGCDYLRIVRKINEVLK